MYTGLPARNSFDVLSTYVVLTSTSFVKLPDFMAQVWQTHSDNRTNKASGD